MHGLSRKCEDELPNLSIFILVYNNCFGGLSVSLSVNFVRDIHTNIGTSFHNILYL